MEKLAIGLWGCFFGTVVVILAGAVLAYTRSLHRIAFNAALSALVSAFFVTAFLGVLPISDVATLARFLALVATLVSALLTYNFFALLGVIRSREARQRTALTLASFGLAALLAGWRLQPLQFLAVSTGVACLLGLVALAAALRSAVRGYRLAWTAVGAICCMLVALGGLSWIALDRAGAPWLLHVVSAFAATLYLATLAFVLWARYSYLLELHKVMAHGPSYDPVTRMLSHVETDQMVSTVFKSFRDKPQAFGVVVLTIANLYTLEQLYGLPAVNHALFVCAGRLRRTVPGNVQLGRLGNDCFVLVIPHCTQSFGLIRLALAVKARFKKPVALNTSHDVPRLETDKTIWVAQIGIGVLMVSDPEARSPDAIEICRRMSRTAMSYASRVAWFDRASGEMVELPDVRL